MGEQVELDQILEARERRAERQRQLLETYRSALVCFTMNIAGPVKNSPRIREGFRLGLQLLHEQLQREGCALLREEIRQEAVGNEACLAVDMEAMRLKKLTVLLEDSTPLGRLFDMDVLGPDGQKIAREQIGLPPRRCLICGKPAGGCARSRAHSVAELQAKTRAILDAGIDRSDALAAGRLAVRALLYEVCTAPKPGLVDRLDSGSHTDMDLFSFLSSAAALGPYFSECTRIGRETAALTAPESFRALRVPGMLAEGEMLAASGGVNTHKGAVFSLGILCGALGRLRREQWRQPDTVLAECAAMAAGLTAADFSAPEVSETAGYRLYTQLGITGIRGEAEAGFPAAGLTGLPVLEAGLSRGLPLEAAGCGALLAILCRAEDTNLLARSDLQTWQETRQRIQRLLDRSPYPDAGTLSELNREFSEKGLSPGGSADLLALCYFLHFLRDV